MYIHIHGKPGD